MEDKEIEKIKQAWQRQAAFLDKVDLFPEKEMLEMIRRRQPSQYQCRRRDKVRTLALQLASLLLCAAAGGLAFGNGLMAWGFVAAAAGLFCLCAVVAAARDLHLLLHVHPAKYSPATVDYYLEKTCRLEALRRLRRRRLSSLLRLPAAPSPRTPRWAGAASAACLLLVVALCLWQLPQPVAPAPRAAQQLASTSAPQPAQPAAFQQTYHHINKTRPQSASAVAPQCVTAKDKGIHGAYNKMLCNEDCDIATVLNVLNVLCQSCSEEIVS